MRREAVLLLGPTGSGKTPLGNLMEKKGLGRQRCYHFDFGENLRLMAKSKKPDKRFTPEEISFINEVLASGALLENEHFYLARKILDWFITRNRVSSEGLIILNGLPRHIGQAKEIDSILDIETVVHLTCAPKTIQARIKNNSGGDRSGRTDDGLDAIKNKIALFNQRTSKLIEHYRAAGTRIVNITVTEKTTPKEMLKALSKHL
ncbi:MAG TPA: nucleoside monophosphate kinase [Planctomycetota bacterium]|nr:nucleoside monophosphate kinase [Planctomycetota bacterium]